MAFDNETTCWEKTKEALRKEMTSLSYTTWIQSLRLISERDGHLICETEDQFKANNIRSRYLSMLECRCDRSARRCEAMRVWRQDRHKQRLR